jgi:hypothetical protein
MKLKIGIALFAIACVAAPAYAQGTTERATQTLSKARRDVFEQAMNLTDQEKDAFWNIYSNFERERAGLIDKTFQLLQEYATHYSTITDEQAMKTVKQTGDLQKKTIELRTKYADQIAKKVSGKQGARFFQIDDYLSSAVRLNWLDKIDFIGQMQ